MTDYWRYEIDDLARRIARLETSEVSPAVRYDDLVMPATAMKQGSNLKPVLS